jgi:hypothetical protein
MDRPGFKISHGRSRVLVWVAAIFVMAFQTDAHVGSPNVFFEGYAGSYRTRVVVRPAAVIPGLAEISVRVEGEDVSQVSALPMKWNTGRKGAPPADIATRVRGETNLFAAQLWFMEPGAHGIEITIQGKQGKGTVIVPINAEATRVLTMPRTLGVALVGLGVLLAALLVSIIGAAARETGLDPGKALSGERVWRARGAMVATATLLVLLLWGGKHWWEAEAADYRNNLLSQPVKTHAHVEVVGIFRTLRIEIPDYGRGAPPLVPDHGKLMHLFMVRTPELDAFAHLHPLKLDKRTYSSVLPPLPAGNYSFYADVTYETGWSDTLTNDVEVPTVVAGTDSREKRAANAAAYMDEDDAWTVGSQHAGLPGGDYKPAGGCSVRLLAPGPIEADKNLDLRFSVRDGGGNLLKLEPYLGMTGHLVVMRRDGAVFTHLHPGGSASMASMQLSALRAEGKLPLQVALGKDEPICQLPKPGEKELAWINGAAQREGTVAFPYAFPRPGQYRLWLQVRVYGKVQTAVFDVEVGKSRSSDT